MIASSPLPRTSTCMADQLLPPSVLRLSTMSVGLASLIRCFRASQKTSSEPLGETIIAGIR